MTARALHPLAAIATLLLLLGGCASMHEPVQVNVVGLDELPGEGMELRMAVKLRIQNPGDNAVDYDGIAIALEVHGNNFATGVSAATGSIPRYGEVLLTVPVSVSALAAVRQALAMAADPTEKFDYILRGKLSGGATGGSRFESRGNIRLPLNLLPQ